MSTRHDPDRVLAAWLNDEARSGAPDRLLSATRTRLASTHQRRSWWPARRFREMNVYAKLAITAAAVAVVALAGIYFLPRGSNVAGPGPSPSPTPTPSPIADFAGGSYAPGTTYAITDPCCVASRMTFTMPAGGWYAPLEPWRIGKDVPGGSDIFDLYVKPHFVDNVYTGGCHWRGTELDPPVGPTVDDLATALVAQAGPGASPAAPVTSVVTRQEGRAVTSVRSRRVQVQFRWRSVDLQSLRQRPRIRRPAIYARCRSGQHVLHRRRRRHATGHRRDVPAGHVRRRPRRADKIIASIRFGSSRCSPSPFPFS